MRRGCCSPARWPRPQETDPARLRSGLRSLAAARIGQMLAAELTAGEDVWPIALGDRYGSVRHRCAPRTTWRSRGLSDLLRIDLGHPPGGGDATGAMADRRRATSIGLAAELEAALVHARTPARFA